MVASRIHTLGGECGQVVAHKYLRHIRYKQDIQPETHGGPGTELKKLLSAIGIRATGCDMCVQRADEMNKKGPQWCLDNIDMIVGWMRDSAARRKLPFSQFMATRLVKLAIRRAQT